MKTNLFTRKWSLHNLSLAITTGYFSFTVTVLFALNRLIFRDLFLENWEYFTTMSNEYVLRFSGLVALFLFTLFIALFIHIWHWIYNRYSFAHLSFMTGKDFFFYTYKQLYSIFWPMQMYLILGTVCYYTIKHNKLKYLLYLIGFFYIIMYCITGFIGYFLAFWLMSCCQKYCKFAVLARFPNGMLTLTEEEFSDKVIAPDF